jgi:hypothetical protein
MADKGARGRESPHLNRQLSVRSLVPLSHLPSPICPASIWERVIEGHRKCDFVLVSLAPFDEG